MRTTTDEDWPLPPPPTPAETTGRVLADWIEEHPDGNACGVAILRDRVSLVVYWKGTPPEDLQRLAAGEPVAVEFRVGIYAPDELWPIAKRLVTDHRGVLESAGQSNDYSGISVTLLPGVSAETMARLQAESEVPLTFRWRR